MKVGAVSSLDDRTTDYGRQRSWIEFGWHDERVKTLYYNVPPSCANSKSLILGMNAVTLLIDELNGICFNSSLFPAMNHGRE